MDILVEELGQVPQIYHAPLLPCCETARALTSHAHARARLS